GVISRAAGQAALDGKVGDACLVGPGDDLFDLSHDLGADAVARQEEEGVFCHVGSRRTGGYACCWHIASFFCPTQAGSALRSIWFRFCAACSADFYSVDSQMPSR